MELTLWNFSPILSASVTAALFKRPIFLGEEVDLQFVNYARQLIVAARNLHHAELFKECFTHIVSSWPDDFYNRSLLKKEPHLSALIQKAHHKLSNDVIS